MIGIVVFNILMLALALAVGAGIVQASHSSIMLEWLHSIIGITPPPREKAPLFALLWIGSMTVLVDGLLFLLVLLTKQMM
jgi:hypothetical protein